jgi:hypothetical protein
LYNNQSITIVGGILLFTGRWITLLSSWPSRERRRPRDDHVILCSTFEFLFAFQNRIFLEFFVRVSSCSNIKPFEVRGSTVLTFTSVVYNRYYVYAVHQYNNNVTHIYTQYTLFVVLTYVLHLRLTQFAYR